MPRRPRHGLAQGGTIAVLHVGFSPPARAEQAACVSACGNAPITRRAIRTWDRIVRRLRRRATAHEGALPLPHSGWDLLRLAMSRLFRGRDHLLVVARKPARP